jgi:hypothetical protein
LQCQLGAQPGRLAVDSAGLAIHVLQHLIEQCPQLGHFLTNKLPAVNQNGRIGLFAFGQFAEAEANLLGIGQPGGMVEPDQLSSRLHPHAGKPAIERMHPPVEALPRLQHRHQGPVALQLVGSAMATMAGANDHHPRCPSPGGITVLPIRQHQSGACGQPAEQKLPAAEGRGPGACSSGELADQTSAHILSSKTIKLCLGRAC